MTTKPNGSIKKTQTNVLDEELIGVCLGPLTDLEKHVRKDWWRKIFNAYYLKTDGDVVEDQKITSEEIDLITKILKINSDNKILDLCCGQGRHTLEFARRGFENVEGLDRSRYLIQKARNNAKKNGLSCKFREGDARKLPHAPDTFDYVVILGNSFGYFEKINDDYQVLKAAARILKPSGRILLDMTDGEYLKEHYQPRSWEWIDKSLFVCRERSLSLDKQRLISREVITHVNKGVLVDQFYAERLYTRAMISDILTRAGFSDIIFHGEIKPDSQRAQDLGMMEKRIVVTASIKKEWAPVKKKEKLQTINISVIMGDPSKSDIIKPSTKFDDDDFYTIDQLKGALKDLESYNFAFLNNHDTLYQDLQKSQGKIDYVFNLCDEGYYNEPRKELHIPALMDVLKIPYTGAGPQCLAFCYDKALVRGIAKDLNIPVPEAVFIKPDDKIIDLTLYFPAIVKPNFGDSSFGITQKSVVYNGVELLEAIKDIKDRFGYDKPIIVEQYLTGKDLSVGIIGNSAEDYLVLPIIEEDYSSLPEGLPKICGYEAKWLPDSPYWNLTSKPAELPPETLQLIESCSIKLFERLECRDYARFDWRLDAEGNPKLLEVNPNPGWCWDGHLAKMSKLAGLSYKQMLEKILTAAEKRINKHLD
jgi:D-alanine-D-alanine ligase